MWPECGKDKPAANVVRGRQEAGQNVFSPTEIKAWAVQPVRVKGTC